MTPIRALWILLVSAAIGGIVPAIARVHPDSPVRGSGISRLEDQRRLSARTRGTVAIAKVPSARHLASGVLVARDLVLTCRHVTHVHRGSGARRPLADLEVRLEIGERAGETSYRRFPVSAYAYTSDRLDLCVLRIGPDEGGALPEASRVQVLDRARVPLGAPLYVVHHPRGGPLHVADDLRVLYPFAATAAELDRLLADATCESARSGIVSSYRLRHRGLCLNYSTRWAGQPVLGADCRTYDGSSGAPVYSRQEHALVGIVFAGGDPRRQRIASRWDHHEAILPAAAILDDLAASPDASCRRLASASFAGP